MEKLKTWIEQNVDSFDNEIVQKKLNKLVTEEKSKQIEALVEKKMGYGRKTIIINQLLSHAEAILLKRR